MYPEGVCSRVCILVAFVWLFSTVCFHMLNERAWISVFWWWQWRLWSSNVSEVEYGFKFQFNFKIKMFNLNLKHGSCRLWSSNVSEVESGFLLPLKIRSAVNKGFQQKHHHHHHLVQKHHHHQRHLLSQFKHSFKCNFSKLQNAIADISNSNFH